jgi:hypothetical protein
MQRRDDDRCWCRCGNASEICIERHGLRAKERWRGEVGVCTAREITAAMCRWQRAERAISCDMRLSDGETSIEKSGGNGGA